MMQDVVQPRRMVMLRRPHFQEALPPWHRSRDDRDGQVACARLPGSAARTNLTPGISAARPDPLCRSENSLPAGQAPGHELPPYAASLRGIASRTPGIRPPDWLAAALPSTVWSVSHCAQRGTSGQSASQNEARQTSFDAQPGLVSVCQFPRRPLRGAGEERDGRRGTYSAASAMGSRLSAAATPAP